jgi:tellurite resistance protein TerB
MVFGALKKAFTAGFSGVTRELNAAYGENTDFLEAVCAAAALVAFADGEIEPEERAKIVSLIQKHPSLGKLYGIDVIEKTSDTMFKRAAEASGRQSLARELDDIKGRPDGARMGEDVYLVALDVANADGELEPEEQAVLAKIAKRLGVDASQFDF